MDGEGGRVRSVATSCRVREARVLKRRRSEVSIRRGRVICEGERIKINKHKINLIMGYTITPQNI